MSKQTYPTPLTKKAFFEITECKCGKYPFKYHNTSKNEFILKCNTTKEEFDMKTKKWVKSKKQPCDMWYAYYGERPIFKEINNVLLKKAKTVSVNKDKILEEKLRLLFQFVFVSNHTSTLDEINILVKNSLKREPRITFYYPSIGHFMRISHYEPLEEYRDRIFSQKIVDSTDLQPPVAPKVKEVKLVPTLIKKSNKKVASVSNFIVTSDNELSENEYESESDRESEAQRELSDYETDDENKEQSIVNEEEENFEEENFDDYDEGCDSDDGYD